MMAMIDSKRKGLTRRSIVVSGPVFCLFSLAACQLPGSGPAPRRIRLSPAESFPPNMPAVAWSLQVQEPTTTLSLDTARIAIGVANDINYLATGEWASRAPEMVMELLVQSFRNSSKILTVGDRRARIRSEFELQLRLSAFHIEKTADDAGTVRVGLDTTLVKRPRRDPLANAGFESSAQVSPLSLEDIVAAFDESLRDVMEQVVEWTLQTGANV
jgi:cholesterol transport system auxiliary component